MDIMHLTVSEAREQMARGDLTPRALAEACYRQIERLNPRLNAFITVERVENGGVETSPLASNHLLPGIPIAVKDLYDTAGIRTTAGSLFFKDHIPNEDAQVVRKLRQAGATIAGKTNTHEIALGVTNVNPHFGACRNPWDTSRVSGGSSGGSTVAVATGMSLAALGTDTGGSIRIPASLCGVVGLKPTYGRVSLRGILPLSWNLDHAGPLAKSVHDAAVMLQVMAGYDESDPASADVPVDDYLVHIDAGVRHWKIALAAGAYIDESDAGVLAALHAAGEIFTGSGAQVVEVEVAWLREAALANALMTTSDGAAFHRQRLAEHPEQFGADVRQRLETGAAYTSSEYALARRKQAEIRRQAEALFREYDLLMLPSTPIAAPLIEGSDAIEQARRLTRFTAPFNLSGLPAISIPCGFTSGNLPIGLQLVAAHWREADLLRAAHTFEAATAWHKTHPEIAV